jgi:hypothetical protein
MCSGDALTSPIFRSSTKPVRLPLLLDFAHRGEGLLDNLTRIHELDVVRLPQVEIVGAQPRQRLVDGSPQTRSRKIETRDIVPAALTRQNRVLSFSFECDAQALLGQGAPIIGRHVEKIDPLIDGRVHRARAFRRIRLSKFIP